MLNSETDPFEERNDSETGQNSLATVVPSKEEAIVEALFPYSHIGNY